MAIKEMGGQLAQAGDMLNLLSGQVSGNAEQLSGIAAQVNRVARIQYKTGQEAQEKLELLHADLEAVRQWQAGHEADAAKLRALEQQNNVVTGMIMSWLDDIDRISTGLRGGEQETWRRLLERWTGQLLQALAELGVYELDLLGASFDPQWAESIGTLDRDPAWNQLPEGESGRFSAPYAMVEVVRRCFASRDGQLLRKAQVVTVREESPAEKHGENNSDGRIRDENNIDQSGNNNEGSGNEDDGNEDDGDEDDSDESDGNEDDGDKDDSENNNAEDGKENNVIGKSSFPGWLSPGEEGGSGS